MQNINRFIYEKLKITSKSQINKYSEHPKDKYELRKILEERLGKDKNANLNDIDISQIKDLGFEGFPNNTGLFEDLDPHNIDISKWDISNIQSMSFMFYKCENFNSNLSKWDVSNIINMEGLFCNCYKFEGNGLENWQPLKVKNMKKMFYNCNLIKKIPKWYHE